MKIILITAKILLYGLIIFLILLLTGNAFSQEIIDNEGKRYVDTDYHNNLVDEYNTCRSLLIECKENTEETVKIVERVVETDKIIIEEVEKIDNKRTWRNRLEGAGCGGSVVVVLFFLLLLI